MSPIAPVALQYLACFLGGAALAVGVLLPFARRSERDTRQDWWGGLVPLYWRVFILPLAALAGGILSVGALAAHHSFGPTGVAVYAAACLSLYGLWTLPKWLSRERDRRWEARNDRARDAAHDFLDAARRGNLSAVRQHLRDRGVFVDTCFIDGLPDPPDGQTALMFAAQNGHADVVRLLLEHGASTEVVNIRGDSPQMLAECNGRTEIVRLLQQGAIPGRESPV
uniref:Uncharacterized protein n=1 Tax=uncultured Armatimonadetes bacterium TaxID=157466 RepID=A0A6J4JGU2_9BACT|nr:hypothetical protein AVDCRST_MAG63-3299 [uncultured Armatimonadetes bacterium]